jgi:cytoskeletal protein CcmA (bactofilin family)
MSGGKSVFKKANSKNSVASEENFSFLGKNTVLEGKMSFKGELRLDGKFDGEILV